MAESTSELRDYIKSLTDFDIMENDNTFKNMKDIIVGIGQKWVNLSDTDQQALLEKLAGKTQSNSLAAALQNWEQIEEIYDTAMNQSEGSAEKENETYLSHIEAQLTKIQNLWQDIWTDTISSEAFTQILEMAESLLKVVKNVGLLKTALAGISGLLFVKSKSKNIDSAISGTKSLFSLDNLKKIFDSDITSATDESSKSSGAGQGKTSILGRLFGIGTEGTTTNENSGTATSTDSETKANKSNVISITEKVQAKEAETVVNGELKGSIEDVTGATVEESSEAAKSSTVYTGLGSSITNFGAKFKAAITGASGTVAGLTAAIGLLVASIAVAKGIEWLTDTKRKADEAREAYEEVASEVDELTESIKTNNEEITSIKSQDTITASDSAKILELQEENQELARELYAKRVEANAEKNEARQASIKYLSDSTAQTEDPYKTNLGPVGGSSKSTIKKATENALAEYKKQAENMEAAQEERKKALASADKEAAEKAQDSYDSYELAKNDAYTQLSTLRQTYEDNMSVLDPVQDADLISEIKEQIAAIDTAFNDAGDSAEAFEEKVAGLFEKDGIELTEEKFTELAQAGTLTIDEITSKYPNLAKAASEANVDLQDMIDLYALLKEAAEEGTEAASDGLYDIDDVLSDTSSQINKVKTEQESSNKGDAYSDMLGYISTAKELAESGDVGTGLFKQIAALFSPTGATDLANWNENLSKINRYFTEDSTGVNNFLADLKEKGYATYQKLSDGTKQWKFNIEDADKASRSLGIGVEAFTALFGELSDKGIENDFFTTEEDGIIHLNSLTEELMTTEEELAYLENHDSGNTTAIEAKKKAIEELKSRIESTTDALEKLNSKTVEDREKEDKENKAGIKSAIKEYNNYDGNMSEEAKTSWMNEIIEAADEKGYTVVEVDGKLKLETAEAKKKAEEAKEEIEANPPRVKGEYVFDTGNTVNPEKLENAGWYTKDKNKDYNGNLTSTYTKTYSSEDGQRSVVVTPVLPDGSVLSPDELDEYVDNVLDGGEDTEGIVLNTFNGDEASANADQYAESWEKVQDLLATGSVAETQYLSQLEDYSDTQLKSMDLFDDSTSKAENNLKELMDELGIDYKYAEQFINVLADLGLIKIEADTEDCQEKLDAINEQMPTDKVVQVIGEDNASYIVTMWNGLFADDKFTELSAEDKASVIINLWNALDANEKYAELTGEDKATALVNLWNNMDAEDKEVVITGVNEAGEVINGFNLISDDGTEVTVTVNDSEFNQKADETEKKLGELDGAEANPSVELEGASTALGYTQSLLGKVSSLNNKTATIKIKTVKETVTTPFNGTAHADGTIPLKTLRYSSPTIKHAYASGTTNTEDWSIKHDEKALINEVGEEGVVRDGKLLTFNNGFPTYANLKKGDIVFNHKQLEELKKHGYVTNSHAKIVGGESSFAKGTVISKAYSSGSSSSSSTDKKLEKFQKFTEKLFDLIEIRLNRLSSLTQKWMDKAEKAIRYSSNGTNSFSSISKEYENQATAIKKALTYTQKQIDANQKGKTKYTSTGNKVLNKAVKTGVISKKKANTIKKKVADGSINVAEYSEKIQTVISEYKTWYDKALDCSDAIAELKEQQKDLYDQLYTNPIDKATAAVEKYATAIEKLGNILNAISGGSGLQLYFKNLTSSVTTAKQNYDTAVEEEATATQNLSTAKKSVKSSSLYNDSSVKKAIKNGTEIDTSKIKNKKNKKIAETYNKALKAKNTASAATKTAKSEYTTAKNNNSTNLKTAAKYQNSPEYEYQNYLIDKEVENQKGSDQERQDALKTAQTNVTKAKKANTKAKEDKKKKQNALLNNKKITSKLSKKQLANLKAGKTISEKGLSGKTLKAVQAYNKSVAKVTSTTTALTSATNALSTAQKDASDSTAELTQAQIEAEQEKFNNIKDYYDSKSSYQESETSKLEAEQALKTATGAKLDTSDYQDLITKSEELEKTKTEEAKKLQEQLDAAVKSGVIVEGSAEWIEMKSEINGVQSEILDAEKAQIEYNNSIVNMNLEKYQTLLDLLDAIASYNDALIDLKEAEGKIITAEDITKQISDNQDKIKALQDEQEEYWKNYQEALASADNAYGGKTAEEWEKEYYNVSAELVNAQKEAIELNEKLNNLGLDKLSRDLETLSDSADRLQDALDIKEAKGLKATVEDYEALIANSKEQVAVLEAENVELRKQQEGLQEGSTKYNELQDQINSNEAAIRDAEKSQIEWNNAIAEIPITILEELLDVLQSIAAYTDSIIDLKTASGEVVTEADYRQQIADRNEQIAALEEERAEYYKNYQAALESEDGTYYGKSADEWKAEYYDLGTEINNVKSEIKELEQAIDNIELTNLSNQLAVLSAEADKLDDAISLKETRGAEITEADYNSLIANSKKQVSNLEAQNAELKKQQANYEEGSDLYEECQRQIEDNESSIRDAQIAQEEWNIAIQNLPLTKLEKTLELYESIASYDQSLNDLKSALGEDLSESDYEQLIADNNQQIQNLLEQREEALSNYQSALNSSDGTYGGKTADEWKAEYNELGTEINNTKVANEELKDSMREDLEFREFTRAAKATEMLRTELETLRAVIEEDDMYDDYGNLTELGREAIAIANKEMKSYQQDIETANAKIARIKAMHGQDGYSEDEYLADLADAESELLSAVQGEVDARNTLKDIIQKSVDLELDAVKELIDKYNDLMDAQKDLYDYQKSIKEQTKEISDLEKQMMAHSGDDSEENKARIQQLKVSYEEAQSNLQDTEYDYYISQTQKMLDDLYDEYEESLNDSVDRMVEALVEQSTELSDLVLSEDTIINDSITNTTDEIVNGTGEISSGISGTTSAIVDGTNSITDGISELSMSISDLDTSVSNDLSNSNSMIQSLLEALGVSTEKNSDETNNVIENISDEIISKFGTEFSGLNSLLEELSKQFGIDFTSTSNEWSSKISELAEKYGLDLNMNFDDLSAKFQDLMDKYGSKFNIDFESILSYLKEITENYKVSTSTSLDSYASGTPSVDRKKLAWTQEDGQEEAIIRLSDGAFLTPLKSGDAVFTSDMTEKLWDLANGDYMSTIKLEPFTNPYIESGLLPEATTTSNSIGNVNQTVNVEFSFPNVQDYEGFIEAMKKDRNFEAFIQSMTIDQLNGGSRLKKYTIR